MKHLKFLSFIALMYSFSVHATEDNTIKIDKQILVTGTWNCLFMTEENGINIILETEENYIRNGRHNSSGVLIFDLEPDMPTIEYFIASSAIWEISGKYLITTFTDVKIKNLSHSEFDDKFNLENMFPKNISNSSEIIELSNSKLSVKSETDGTIYNCTKKAL